MNKCGAEPECGNVIPCKSRKRAYRKTYDSLGKHPVFLLLLEFDRSPRNCNEQSVFSQAISGFNIGLDKAMTSDLDGLR